MASLILFAIVLIIAGGGIAWLGDWLGTRIGKKRLSVFGLRPRHTATLLTVASGVGIALLTLGLLVTYDYTVRRALLHGQEIMDANNALKAQNGAQRKQIAAGEARLSDEQASLAAAEAKLEPIQAQLTQARVALGQSRQTLTLRQARLETAQGQLSATQQTLGATHADLSRAQGQVRQAKQALGTAQGRVQYAQSQVHSLTQQGTQVAQQNARLRRAGQMLAARAKASQRGLIYRTGQEVGRLVIKTPQPVVSVERQLTAFLDEMGRQAVRRHGLPGLNGRAVAIAVPAGGGEFRALAPAQERDAARALAQNIAGDGRGAGSVVVVAQVAYNAFEGEQTDIELHPYANVLIYPKNTPIASETINGDLPATEVLGALQAFLTERVRPAAIHQGLIPQTDPQTGRPVAGGTVDQNTSQALVDQISQIGGPVRVTAYADADIYSSGPLRLRLSASPAGAS